MATAWSRFAFSEEFASPSDQRIDQAALESSDPTPAANAAPSPVVLSEGEIDGAGKYDQTAQRIDQAALESSDPTPAANAAPSPVVLSEGEIDDAVKYDQTARASTKKIFSHLEQELLSQPSSSSSGTVFAAMRLISSRVSSLATGRRRSSSK
jgi:hypothetical protein